MAGKNRSVGTITKRIEFDAGHRLPQHKSKCRHLHGHRYRMEVTLQGPLCDEEGSSSQGMVLDFSEIKSIAQREIADPWDHAFLVYEGDHQVVEFLRSLPDHKTVVLSVIPTAENLAQLAFSKLSPIYESLYPELHLARVRLYETPNSWADAVK